MDINVLFSCHFVSPDDLWWQFINSYKPGNLFVRHRHNCPRCDAAERGIPSGAILFALKNLIGKWNKNLKLLLTPLKMKVGKSICHIWVNLSDVHYWL